MDARLDKWRQMVGWTDGRTNRKRNDVWMSGQMEKPMDFRMNKQINGWIDEWLIDRLTKKDKRTDGRTNRWTDRQTARNSWTDWTFVDGTEFLSKLLKQLPGFLDGAGTLTEKTVHRPVRPLTGPSTDRSPVRQN